jgi:uncharacterized integral membrane protein (TIGR00698 family)
MHRSARPLLPVRSRGVPGWVVPAAAVATLCPGISGTMALAGGIVLGMSGGNVRPERTAAAARWLLQVSVVALGATVQLGEVAHAGVAGLAITFLSILAVLALGRWLGRRLKVPTDAALLVSGGTAICGGSAIAALAGALRPRPHEVTLSLATVFVLNAIALVVFPPIGHAFGLTQRQFGWWAALAIHDTSSVVGAGLAYGSSALAIATTVKLARAIWIAPLTFGLAIRRRHGMAAVEGEPAGHFPWFILGFVAVAGVVSVWPAVAPAALRVGFGAQRLLVATLFLIGAGFTREALRAVGLRPLTLGVLLWVTVASVSLAMIRLGWIG